MTENREVKEFMELFKKDASLQKAFAEAEASYPGSLEIREAVVEDVLLPLARHAGFDFTVEDLRNYETGVYLRNHRDEEQDADAPDDETCYFLLEHGWTNDGAAFQDGDS